MTKEITKCVCCGTSITSKDIEVKVPPLKWIIVVCSKCGSRIDLIEDDVYRELKR